MIIPADLIWKILLHLPPIYVLRFKLVSKQWYALISSPEFPLIHSLHFHKLKHSFSLQQLPGFFIRPYQYDQLHKHPIFYPLLHHFYDQNPPQVNYDRYPAAALSMFPTPKIGFAKINEYCKLYISKFPRIKINDINIPKIDEFFKLHDSCNGLYLYITTTHPQLNIIPSITPDSYVCNPITKQYIKLPKNPYIDTKTPTHFHQPNLAFDPYSCTSTSLSFKVVQCTHGLDINTLTNERVVFCQFIIYSSNTGLWKPSTKLNNVAGIVGLWPATVVYSNGVLCYYSTFSDVSQCICFNVEKECAWEMPLPRKKESLHCRKICLYFGACGTHGKCIRLIETNDINFKCSILFCIWETEHHHQQHLWNSSSDGDEFWIKRYNVNLKQIYTQVKDSVENCRFRILYIDTRSGGEDGEGDVMLINIYGKKFVCIHLGTSKTEYIENIPTIPCLLDGSTISLNAFQCATTFFPLY